MKWSFVDDDDDDDIVCTALDVFSVEMRMLRTHWIKIVSSCWNSINCHINIIVDKVILCWHWNKEYETSERAQAAEGNQGEVRRLEMMFLLFSFTLIAFGRPNWIIYRVASKCVNILYLFNMSNDLGGQRISSISMWASTTKHFCECFSLVSSTVQRDKLNLSSIRWQNKSGILGLLTGDRCSFIVNTIFISALPICHDFTTL